MKHKNSVLICQLDNGQLNLYVNGAQVLDGMRVVTPIGTIANSKTNLAEVLTMLDEMSCRLVSPNLIMTGA